MSIRMPTTALVVLASTAVWSSSPHAQVVIQRPDIQNLAGPPPPLAVSAGSNRVVSPTTVAFWQQHDNGDGTGALDLLLLWRGTPGWFFRGGSSSGGGDGGGGFDQWKLVRWMAYGDVTLTIEFTSRSKDFDPASTSVTILGRQIALRDTNVILIDGADSGAQALVDTQHVEPTFTGRDPVAAIIKRSPNLFEFLQCDAVLPDSNQQAMMSTLCGQMRP